MYEELQCTVCRDLLCRPHTLSCSHTFCADCLFGWAKREKRRAAAPNPARAPPRHGVARASGRRDIQPARAISAVCAPRARPARGGSCIICREPFDTLPTAVRQLDGLTSKLATSLLPDDERRDWLARAE
eukprot:7268275-Prymnesium_polylepis.1